MTATLNINANEFGCESIQSRANSCKRILLVNGERDLRQLNAEVLIDAGYQVDIAADGATAWSAIQISKYDLLITDQFLPKVSGVQLARRIHNARMPLPVIMTTDIVPTWEFALHPCLQTVTMLQKPYSIEKLLSLANNFLPVNFGVDEGIVPLLNRQTAGYTPLFHLSRS